MKKLLFIVMATMPSLMLSMENGAIKIYELAHLKARYQELLPISDEKFHKGWGQEQPGRGFLYGSGLAGIFNSGCYQPTITDITAANLLHYYQQHENKINQLLTDTTPLRVTFEANNASLNSKMNALRTEYDATTQRHNYYINECREKIVRHDASHVTNITNLQNDSREHGLTIGRHDARIITLQQNMQDYNRATDQIAQLQREIHTHTTTIALQDNQIVALQKELNIQQKASAERKNEINRFIDTTMQQKNEYQEQHIDQLLKDVALLKKALEIKNVVSYGKNNNLFTQAELLNTYNMAYVLLNSNFNPTAQVSLNRLFDLIERIRPGHQSTDPIEQSPAYFASQQPDEEEISNEMCTKLRIIVLFNQLNRYLQDNNIHHPKKCDYYDFLQTQGGSDNKGINNFKALTLSVAKTNARRGSNLKSVTDKESVESDKGIESVNNNSK